MASGPKRSVVFLCSGGGGNLRFAWAAIQKGWLPLTEIAAVIVDKECAASDFAQERGLTTHIANFRRNEQRALLELLEQLSPDLIVCTINRIIEPTIVDRFAGRIINLHYSLLPAFGGTVGTQPVAAAVNHGARFTGVTTHHVTEQLDGGTPIVQIAIPLLSGEAVEQGLMNDVFQCGCLALLSTMGILLHAVASVPEIVHLNGRLCLSSAPVCREPEVSSADFWRGLVQAEPS